MPLFLSWVPANWQNIRRHVFSYNKGGLKLYGPLMPDMFCYVVPFWFASILEFTMVTKPEVRDSVSAELREPVPKRHDGPVFEGCEARQLQNRLSLLCVRYPKIDQKKLKKRLLRKLGLRNWDD